MAKGKILVVDDEKEITDLISLYLTNENFTVRSFYDSIEAYETIQKEEFDLAILHVMMLQMDGFKLCQEIRKEHNYPIIMLTAKTEDMDKLMGFEHGADDYVTKPFSPAELTARIDALYRRIGGDSMVDLVSVEFCGAVSSRHPNGGEEYRRRRHFTVQSAVRRDDTFVGSIGIEPNEVLRNEELRNEVSLGDMKLRAQRANAQL